MPHLRRLRDLRDDQRGFTLPEVLITTILLGILLTIATSTWFGVIESRTVDSATNQLSADLQLAHTRATNRLVPQTVTLTAGSSEYTVTGLGTRDLDDDSVDDLATVAVSSTMVFASNGAVQVTGANPIEVRSTNDITNNHTIELNTVTSRTKVVP